MQAPNTYESFWTYSFLHTKMGIVLKLKLCSTDDPNSVWPPSLVLDYAFLPWKPIANRPALFSLAIFNTSVFASTSFRLMTISYLDCGNLIRHCVPYSVESSLCFPQDTVAANQSGDNLSLGQWPKQQRSYWRSCLIVWTNRNLPKTFLTVSEAIDGLFGTICRHYEVSLSLHQIKANK